jgi:hypothetical protein
VEAGRRNRNRMQWRNVGGNEWLTSAIRILCLSVLTMSVPDRAFGGGRLEGKTPRNELTSLRQHIICRVSIMRNL